ncbi:MAG: putative O-glycosylation ligase, exosortase A system-associated [Magnetococcales bacterium]|nr:putative O-glycosylation ligase, exosortase A system-associated [Magnetococcales bacterium]
MRDIILTLFIFAMLPICFMRPQIGLLMWTWISYMNPHRLTWSFAYEFRFNYIVAIATILGIFFAKDIAKKIPITNVTITWLFFVFWICLTTYFALSGKALWEWQRTMKIQAMILVTLLVIRDRKWIEALVWVIALSLGFWGVKGGLFTLLYGGSYHVYGPDDSFFGDNNTMALAILMAMPLLYYVYLRLDKPIYKIGMLVVMFLNLVTIIGTYSRGGLVGLMVMGLSMVWKTNRRFSILFILAIVAQLGFVFMPEKWQERMLGITMFSQEEVVAEDASVSGRINSWLFALNLVADRPILGAGFSAFTKANFDLYAPVKEVHDAHSIYFEVLAEQGIPGFTLFILLFVQAFLLGRRILRMVRSRPDLVWAKELASMVQNSLIGYAVAGAFLGMAYFDVPYHMTSVMVVLYLAVKKAVQTAPPPDVIPSRSKNDPTPFVSIFDPPRKPTPASGTTKPLSGR